MFNKSLASYVKHMLPELGIHKVKIVTFFEWAHDIIKTMLGRDVYFLKDNITRRVARFKSHHRTFQNLKKYLEENNSYIIKNKNKEKEYRWKIGDEIKILIEKTPGYFPNKTYKIIAQLND